MYITRTRAHICTAIGEPQSHFVRARTDDSWDKENTGFGQRVRGRVWWPSPALEFRVT